MTLCVDFVLEKKHETHHIFVFYSELFAITLDMEDYVAAVDKLEIQRAPLMQDNDEHDSLDSQKAKHWVQTNNNSDTDFVRPRGSLGVTRSACGDGAPTISDGTVVELSEDGAVFDEGDPERVIMSLLNTDGGCVECDGKQHDPICAPDVCKEYECAEQFPFQGGNLGKTHEAFVSIDQNEDASVAGYFLKYIHNEQPALAVREHTNADSSLYKEPLSRFLVDDSISVDDKVTEMTSATYQCNYLDSKSEYCDVICTNGDHSSETSAFDNISCLLCQAEIDKRENRWRRRLRADLKETIPTWCRHMSLDQATWSSVTHDPDSRDNVTDSDNNSKSGLEVVGTVVIEHLRPPVTGNILLRCPSYVEE